MTDERTGADAGEILEDEGTEDTENVRDRPSTVMYLPADLVDRLEVTAAKLNAESRRVRGKNVEKNRELYPALVRVALKNLDQVREEIGLPAEDGG